MVNSPERPTVIDLARRLAEKLGHINFELALHIERVMGPRPADIAAPKPTTYEAILPTLEAALCGADCAHEQLRELIAALGDPRKEQPQGQPVGQTCSRPLHKKATQADMVDLLSGKREQREALRQRLHEERARINDQLAHLHAAEAEQKRNHPAGCGA
jgi:hypothetical protein